MMLKYDGKDQKRILSELEANKLDAPDYNEIIEMERQARSNEEVLEVTKKEFIQAYRDLKAFGITQENIYSLLN